MRYKFSKQEMCHIFKQTLNLETGSTKDMCQKASNFDKYRELVYYIIFINIVYLLKLYETAIVNTPWASVLHFAPIGSQNNSAI